MHSILRLAVVICGAAACIWASTAAADGPVDPTFGYAGRPYTFPVYVGRANVQMTGLAQDSQGHLISAGKTSDSSNVLQLLTRLNLESPVGLDSNFGSSGVAANPFGSLIPSGAVAVAVDHQNRIVTAGFFVLHRSCGSSPDVPITYFAAARIKNGGDSNDGQVDTSFGSGSLRGATGAMVGDCNYTSGANALTIGAHDEVTVGGSTSNGVRNGIALVRWDASGAIDTSFGDDGAVSLYASIDIGLGALATDEQGRVLAVAYEFGPHSEGIHVYRFNMDGSLDETFGTSGQSWIDTGPESRACCIALDSESRVLVAGTGGPYSTYFAFAARLSNKGEIDSSFGYHGVAMPLSPSGASGMALDRQGRPLLAGTSEYGVATLVLLNLDGSLNRAVGFDGVFTTPIGLQTSNAASVIIDSLGRPNIAILTDDREGDVSGVVRYDEIFGDGLD